MCRCSRVSTRSSLKNLSAEFTERKFSEGQELTAEGSGGAGFFVIESGTAKVTVDGEDRRTLGPGDFYGEIALIDGGTRTATITATSDGVAYGLTKWQFKPLIEMHGEIAWPLLEAMAKRTRELDHSTEPRTRAGDHLGLPGVARDTRRTDGAVRGEHLLRRAATGVGPARRARRRNGDPPARPLAARGARARSTCSSRTSTSTTSKGSGSSRRCSPPGCAITIWGPPQEGSSLAERIAGYLSPPFFPRRFDELPSKIEFVELGEETWQLDGLTHHLGARDPPGNDARLPDRGGRTRRSRTSPTTSSGSQPESGAALADGRRPALPRRAVHAGRVRQPCRLGPLEHRRRLPRSCKPMKPARSVMFHHDPSHSDDFLESMRATVEEQTRRRASSSRAELASYEV